MGKLELNALHTYKAVVKAFVRSNKRSKILQRTAENKQQIALLTYKRMNVVREMNSKNIDMMKKTRLIKDMQVLNKKVQELKKIDPAKDRKLYFLEDNSNLKNIFLSYKLNERNVNHFLDVSSFLTNQREYDELLERYNPGKKLSQEEIVKRTAERVGLDVPL